MKVQHINFKGIYKEEITDGFKDRTVVNELKRAKPFLKLLASSMPGDKDLFVKVEDDPADTILSVDCFDRKTNESYNLAKDNEHTVVGSGCRIMEDTFKGLEKYDKKVFDYATKAFVKRLSRIDTLYTPRRFKDLSDKYICLECGCIVEKHDR